MTDKHKLITAGVAVLLLALVVGASSVFIFTKQSSHTDTNTQETSSLEDGSKAASDPVDQSDEPGASMDETDANNAEEAGGSDAYPDDDKLPDNSTEGIQEIEGVVEGSTMLPVSGEQSGGVVRVSSEVTNAPSEGMCVFVFTAEDSPIVLRQNRSVAQGASQTCTTEVNEVEFTRLGSWGVKVSYSYNNKGLSVEGNVEIN